MIRSTNIDDLHPAVAQRVKALKARAEKELGIELRITATYRDNEYQNFEFSKGRNATGQVVDKSKVVTNARGGQSWHQYKCAVDVVPIKNGVADWGTTKEGFALWQHIGAIGEECGLEWAYRWKSFPEMAHFQYTAGLSMADLAAGKVPA